MSRRTGLIVPLATQRVVVGQRSLVNAHHVRMARVNITMPDHLYHQARHAGLNFSQVAQRGVTAELARLAKIAELDAYLAELESELGPTSDAERVDAKEWADRLLGSTPSRRPA